MPREGWLVCGGIRLACEGSFSSRRRHRIAQAVALFDERTQRRWADGVQTELGWRRPLRVVTGSDQEILLVLNSERPLRRWLVGKFGGHVRSDMAAGVFKAGSLLLLRAGAVDLPQLVHEFCHAALAFDPRREGRGRCRDEARVLVRLENALERHHARQRAACGATDARIERLGKTRSELVTGETVPPERARDAADAADALDARFYSTYAAFAPLTSASPLPIEEYFVEAWSHVLLVTQLAPRARSELACRDPVLLDAVEAFDAAWRADATEDELVACVLDRLDPDGGGK